MPYDLTTMQSIYHGQDEIVEITYNGSPVYQSGPDYTEPFYVQNITNSNETATIYGFGSDTPVFTVETSTDNNTWSTLGTTGENVTLSIPLAPNDKVYIRAVADKWDAWAPNNTGNKIRGCSKVGGNIMSLFYGSNFDGTQTTLKDVGAARNLFDNNTNLLDASKLQLTATTLTQECYARMFIGCTNLVNPPEIPDVALVERCYERMFDHCESLTSAPVLSAAYLGSGCYGAMFYECSNLAYVKCLAISGIDGNTTVDWLQGVSATGTFVKATGTTWPTGINGIPEGWTVIEQ